MKNGIVGVCLVTGLIASTTRANATVYYVADCQPGASAGCVAGNANNTGLSAGTPKQTFSQLPALVAGDQVLFAKGGSWTNAAFYLSGGTSASNPVVVDSYAPSWGGTAKPIIRSTSAGTSIISVWSGSGYIIRNVRLQGNANDTDSRGVFIYTNNDRPVTNVVLDTVEIDQAGMGVHCAASTLTVRPQYVTLRNSKITNNSAFGILSDCDDLLVENNTFDNNGTQPVFHHNIYLDGIANRNVVRKNTLTRSAFVNGVCTGTDIEVEGVKADVTIQGNLIDESTGAAPGCWGIEVVNGYAGRIERHDRVLVSGNTIVNVGNGGIVTSSCNTCTLENNVVAWTASTAAVAIYTGSEMSYGSDPDAGDSKVTVRNNSIYFADTNGVSYGVRVGQNGPNDTTVVSNLIYYATGSNANCFNTAGAPLTHFIAFNNNLCYRASGSGIYSDVYSTLSGAQAAGFDTAGTSVNPMLAAVPSAGNHWSMPLSGTGSPAYNAGHASLSSTLDALGNPRDSQPDIGAFEYSAGGAVVNVPPAAPTNLVVY